MAITAAIAVSSATCTAQQAVTVTCTVTNTGTGSVNITAIQPLFMPAGSKVQSVSGALGLPPTGPGMTVAVAGSSGTLALSWQVIPHAPQVGLVTAGANPTSQVYDVGATVYTNDGSITAATTTTLTVSSMTH